MANPKVVAVVAEPALKVVEVEVEGVGTIEFREPLFNDFAPIFMTGDEKKIDPLALLRLTVYKDGKRMFDSPVGASAGMALMKHVHLAIEVCGMSDAKKELPTENE